MSCSAEFEYAKSFITSGSVICDWSFVFPAVRNQNNREEFVFYRINNVFTL